MNEQELKEAIEKSNIETEAKAELIEIVEIHEEEQKAIDRLLGVVIMWNTMKMSDLVAMHDLWAIIRLYSKYLAKKGEKLIREQEGVNK